MEKYFINGFEEGKKYFFELVSGNVTKEQKERLLNGEEIEINGNIFQIKK